MCLLACAKVVGQVIVAQPSTAHNVLYETFNVRADTHDALGEVMPLNTHRR